MFWKVGIVCFILSVNSNFFNLASDVTNIAIVNLEAPYTNLTYQECHYAKSCSLANLSCRFLDHFKHYLMEPKYYNNKKSALSTLRDGYTSGVIYFSDNFTDAYVARMALGEDSDKETIEQSMIQVWLKNSGKCIPYDSTQLNSMVQRAFFLLLSEQN